VHDNDPLKLQGYRQNLNSECRSGKVRWPKTAILPLCHATNQKLMIILMIMNQ